MDVGKALSKVFKGKEIVYKEGKLTKKAKVHFHFGDQLELNKWVGIQNNNSASKYPLIFYVVNSEKKYNNNHIRTKARVILMNVTKYDTLNSTRVSDSYEKILYPLRDLFIKELSANLNTVVYGKIQDKFKQVDVPLMGVSSDDLKSFGNYKSVTIDIVDAIAIDFDLEININCV